VSKIDHQPPAGRTLQELLRELRDGFVLRQPVLVELDAPGPDASASEHTRSVRLQRVGDELPEELAGCRCHVISQPRLGDRKPKAITVGRARTCDVVIEDASVSKLHATIAHDHDRDLYTVSDERSRNGTSIDGNRVEPAGCTVLYAGAKLAFGDATFVFLDPPTLRKLARLAP
jgi:FHA domain